jgi:hypothetical protein
MFLQQLAAGHALRGDWRVRLPRMALAKGALP